tara:strand:+ start:947 stop:1207 length:261 start_codon:yes stop_codon:yes gene_type:complete
MAEWNISGSVTLPPGADGLQIRYLGDANTGGYANFFPPSSFSFIYEDNSGIKFYLIFELLDEFGDPLADSQPIIHGPYDSSVVGTP